MLRARTSARPPTRRQLQTDRARFGKTVTVSFLGYDTKKISVRDIHLFKLITLADASNKLEDVVVVGLRRAEERVARGRRAVGQPSDLQACVEQPLDLVRGKIAGVIAVQTSGEPGADGANFWIRGISTFGSGQVAAADPRRRGDHQSRCSITFRPRPSNRSRCSGRHGNGLYGSARRQRRRCSSPPRMAAIRRR